MKSLGEKLLGSTARFSFEQRIFNFAMLMGIVLTVFGMAMNVYYSQGIVIDLAFLGCWLLLNSFSRSGRNFRVVSIIAISVLVFAFIPYEWVSSTGTQGSIPYYTILLIAVISIILRGWLRAVMVVSLLAVELLLLTVYDAKEAWLAQGHIIDIGIHLSIILAAMAILIVVYSNTYMKEKQRREEYAQTIEAHVRQQLYYMENLEQLIGKLKSERHDYNNHLSVIHGLLESGETDKAKSYAAALVKNAVEYQSIVNVPYPAVRALLNHKLSIARESGIALKLDVGLPENLNLSEFDLTAILGNLLDNAMEACAGIHSEPYLEFTLKYQPNYLVIRISNPFLNAQEDMNRSTKPDAENHGFGLKNVTCLVERHNGLIEIKHHDNIFEVDIALLVE